MGKNNSDSKEKSISMKPIYKIICIGSSIALIITYLLVIVPFPPAFGIDRTAWVGFLGSILGCSIGGVITFLGVKITIEYSIKMQNKERKLQLSKGEEKEIKSNMPHFYIQYKGCGGGLQSCYYICDFNKAIRCSLEMINFGMNAALDIECKVNFNEFNGTNIEKNLFENKKILMKDERYEFSLGIPIQKVCKIEIKFQDLLGNDYIQEIVFEHNGNSELNINNGKPELYKLNECYINYAEFLK